jgi:NifU homolog involved in Fe-S cluster formation
MSTPLEQLYTRDILALAASLPLRPFQADADYTARVTSPVCGSDLNLSMAIDGRQNVIDFGYDIRACAFGQASMSIFARHVIGAPVATIQQAGISLREILKAERDANALWADFKVLSPLAEIPMRHGAVLLPFAAFDRIVEQYKRRRA